MAYTGVGGSGHLYGYNGIACAVIRQAYQDAQKGNGEREDAIDFLRSEGAAVLLANLSDVLSMDLDGEALGELCARLGVRG